MSDPRVLLGSLMRSMIEGAFGCYDAAAETINARWGRGASKGTISKKVAGLLDWTICDVVALEDAAGRYPVTRMLARRLAEPAAAQPVCMIAQAGGIAREAGEAVAALLRATQEAGAGQNAAALKELMEVEAAVRAAIHRLEAGP